MRRTRAIGSTYVDNDGLTDDTTGRKEQIEDGTEVANTVLQRQHAHVHTSCNKEGNLENKITGILR